MNKKILPVTIFSIIFLIGIVSAVGDYDIQTGNRFVGKQNQNLTIYDSCTNNGIDCDVSFECNFTITKPNNNILINNVATTKDGNLYLYNLSSSQTTDLGIYEVNSYCYNGTVGGRLTFYYEITPNGFINNLGFYIIVLLLSLGIMILGFSIKDGWTVIFGTFGLYFLGIYILFYGISGFKDTVYTQGFAILLLGLAGYFSIRSGIEMIN